MLCEDEYVAREASDVLGDIEYVETKKSTGYFSGDHKPLDQCRQHLQHLREGAKRAVQNASKIAPVKIELPLTNEVDLSADSDNDPPLGARPDDNIRFIDKGWPAGKDVTFE